MLEEQSFETISIKELCDRALVRRATFYKHFADKYDFAIFVVRDLQQQFFEESNFDYNEPYPKTFYLNATRKSITFCAQNEVLIQSILRSNMSGLLLEALAVEISHNLSLRFREDIARGACLPADPELLAQFYTGSLLQVIRWWIMQSNRISEEALVEQLFTLFNSTTPKSVILS